MTTVREREVTTMTNATMFNELVNGYNALAYTHNYMFGYEDRGNIYCTITTSEVLPYVCTLDRASRGAGFSLRFKPNKSQKELLKTNYTFIVCSADFFKATCNEMKYNRGELFEKLITEWYGQTWVKDNVPFTEDGDLTVDGIAYQIKYEKATFINEKTLYKMNKGLGA